MSWVLTALGVALIGGGVTLFIVSQASSANPGRSSGRQVETGLTEETAAVPEEQPGPESGRDSLAEPLPEQRSEEVLVGAGGNPAFIELLLSDPAARPPGAGRITGTDSPLDHEDEAPAAHAEAFATPGEDVSGDPIPSAPAPQANPLPGTNRVPWPGDAGGTPEAPPEISRIDFGAPDPGLGQAPERPSGTPRRRPSPRPRRSADDADPPAAGGTATDAPPPAIEPGASLPDPHSPPDTHSPSVNGAAGIPTPRIPDGPGPGPGSDTHPADTHAPDNHPADTHAPDTHGADHDEDAWEDRVAAEADLADLDFSTPDLDFSHPDLATPDLGGPGADSDPVRWFGTDPSAWDDPDGPSGGTRPPGSGDLSGGTPFDNTGAPSLDSTAGPAIRIVRLIPAQPAVAVMPDPDAAGPEQISTAYQKVTPPPGASIGEPENHASLTVANLGTAVVFYRDLLGLVLEHIGDRRVVLRSGPVHVTLTVDPAYKPGRGALIHLMLQVDDVRAAYDALRARGVRFVHEPRPVSRFNELDLWSAAFRDPDGHGIALIKWDVPAA